MLHDDDFSKAENLNLKTFTGKGFVLDAVKNLLIKKMITE